MYHIGICDDGQHVCAFIEAVIAAYMQDEKRQVEITVWSTGEGLCEYLKQGNSVDILYLDIELCQMNGIHVGDYIRNTLKNHNMQIIYISGKQSYALQLFKNQPMDFLVKPIREEDIWESLHTACSILEVDAKRFEYQQGNEYLSITYGEILYFVSEGRKIRVVTTRGDREFYGKLKEVSKKVSGDFLTIHKSYLVNKHHILHYAYETVEMDNGELLNISQANRKSVRETLLREV